MGMTYETSSTGNAITFTTGVLLGTDKGKRPEPTPTELLATRAVESKDGWLGQIIMAGEIVWESEPQVDSDDEDEEFEAGSQRALAIVNRHVHDAFRRLIVGKQRP